MNTTSVTSILVVRRSILIRANAERVWEEFSSFERMAAWWGAMIGTPEAGTANGQRLVRYEPGDGGHIEMEVSHRRRTDKVRREDPGVRTRPRAHVRKRLDTQQGWLKPTLITIRLTEALGGTLVELTHHGFEHTGGDIADEHAGYESGWGMTQLWALKRLAEAQ